MLVIVASAWDEVARALARRWGHVRASLLTPLDLSRSGWRWRPDSVTRQSAVVQREVIDPAIIDGVLTRLPRVSDVELPHIVAQDREYVAAEMHAFLFAWLSGLPCLVLNRPTAFCLAGPSWRHEQWIHFAAQVGLSVEPARRRAALGAPVLGCGAARDNVVSITIVGNRHIGSSDPILVGQARQLAVAAGVDLVTISFSKSRGCVNFIGANLWPNIDDPVVADLLLDVFSGADGAGGRGAL